MIETIDYENDFAAEVAAWPGPSPRKVPPLTPALCYRFVLSNPHVHVVLTGPKNQRQLEENFQAIGAGRLSGNELEWIREYGRLVRTKKKMGYI